MTKTDTKDATPAFDTAEDAITRQLALVAVALEDCFAKAQTITGNDQYGYKRGAEFQSAELLLKASAKLGLALARIKGEFNQNIRVHRGVSENRGSNGRERRREPERPEDTGNG